MAQERELICIEDTRFIFQTNFSGDPRRDSFGSDARKATIVIPDPRQAQALFDAGFNVKQTKPRVGEEEGFEPTYFVSVNINYDSAWPPKICLVSGDAEPRELDESSVGILDKCDIRNVNVVLNPYHNPKTKRSSLYVQTMYAEQDLESDPFASRYYR